jgi:hypothetical protein
VSDVYVDVNQRLVWSRTKLHRKRLIVALMGLAAGLTLAFFLVDTAKERFLAWGAIALCLPWSFYEIYRWLEPNSALVELLPQGIIFRTTTEDFIVPWTEIKGIDTIDIHAEFRGRAEFYPGVTVILVSQIFYDRVVHVDTLFMRGPGWDAHFIKKDANTMQLALHHEIIPAGADEIRRQVEARWKVFGRASPEKNSAKTL